MQSPRALTGATPAVSPSWQRLLVVRLSSMGDVIHTLPAVAALRQAFPAAQIGWVIEERWAELLCARSAPRLGPLSPEKPLVDAVHVVNMRAWRWAPFSAETWKQARASFHQLRGAAYQAAVDFQGAVRSSLLARWIGVPVRFGFDRARERAASLFYTRRVVAHGVHIIEQNLSLAAALAQRDLPLVPVDFPRDQAAEDWCQRRLRQSQVRDFAILNPGAGWGAKQWPPQRYAEVARGLAERGLRSLVNFGPGEEELARRVEAESAGASEAVACSLAELIALTRRARLFAGGDTGPMHLAAALGVPVVGIFGPTDPARNGPFRNRSIVLRSHSSATTHSRRRQPEAGLLEISAQQVLEAAGKLLEERHA